MSSPWTHAAPKPYRWVLLLGLPLLIGVLLRPAGIAVEVEAKSWRRDIEIERRVLEMHSDWCAQMPTDAELLERQLRQDPEGVRGEAEHCRFRAPVWRARGLAVAEGDGSQAPHWPVLQLKAPGTPEGERAGKRHERQELLLRDERGRSWSCRIPLSQWQAWPVGARTRLAVHRFSGVADCSSLPPAPR